MDAAPCDLQQPAGNSAVPARSILPLVAEPTAELQVSLAAVQSLAAGSGTASLACCSLSHILAVLASERSNMSHVLARDPRVACTLDRV